jgi:predicted dehydrogenase
MKQVLQDLKDGATRVTDVPAPRAARGQILVRTTRTLVSAGTERMLVEFGRAGWIDKARQQPDKVRAVLEKIATDGLMPTIEAVRNKLSQPLAMGYSNVGEVIEVGAGVSGFAPGDRVASNGRHAEIVAVPVNLAARVPEGVSDDAAAFTVLGAIALQGVRLANPTLGESVAVVGLGLIGLVTVQLLRANGCRVIGIDFDPQKLALAQRFGAQTVNLSAGANPVDAALNFTGGRGIDAVIITASTSSNDPVRQAAGMSRKRGRIVLVGVTGLELSRADFFEKELSFQVSCSYGPGRYDPNYEDKGQDYPLGFVRWTEQRNFEAMLELLAERRVEVESLVTHRFAIDDAERAYAVVAGSEPSLGILLAYEPAPGAPDAADSRRVNVSPPTHGLNAAVALGFLGAGNYAGAKLIPAFRATQARLVEVASAGGVSSLHAARKFGIERATTDQHSLLSATDVNAVVIATRHSQHAAQVLAAREQGKHVFVEKPLCLTLEELARIEAAYSTSSPLLMVGFNRRFAPQVTRLRALLTGVSGPKAFVFTVNAGAIPATHWTQDPEVGGGRIIGEACHFIDLLRFLAGSRIADHAQSALAEGARDSATIMLRFEDGSTGTIHYLSNGSKAFPKERLEVFAGGRIVQLDNFRKMRGFGWPGFKRMNLWRQDKGQDACAQAFVDAIKGGHGAPIPLDQIIEVARVSIEVAQELR